MAIRAGDVGLCAATLLTDPMSCDEAAFASIAQAAASAGFGSLSVWPFQVLAIGLERVASILDDAGVSVGAVEAATQWTDGPSAALSKEVAGMVETAVRLGAGVVACCMLDPRLDSLERATSGFAALCAEVEPHGLKVSLEFLPWTGVPDLATAWRIVEGAGHDSGGILLDTWHWVRQPGGPDLELLRSIPGSRIPYVQVCDTGPQAGDDLYAEAMTDRRLPGEGGVDFATLFDALDSIGAEPYVATEVFSTELAGLGPQIAAQRNRQAATAVLSDRA